ncbi:TPA: hypothetical protein SBB50_001767 [Campylobacter jejuni]|uniref:hypothetical protein n=1 Tax=Campylobacter armoricus TaxID=2505970 RepID=UPI00070D0BDF|nr:MULTISPECIES: hypothetical protein [Campylobacter]EAJ2846395.1 hypothetical protein [Campylobacter coli]ECO3812531.1 hypothetical protein [Campylobacter jejuni]ECO6899257.1 hypothetical protein [Campylobacter jejuni]ECP9530474.1 hypothetical protein [Campylobacter jejuni]EDP6229592.1 hypothetical protein [Campylobacter jejuni]
MEKEQQQSSLITGLWKHKNLKGEEVLIGRIGGNLNAVVVKNPNFDKNDKKPEFLLYFFNGQQDINKINFDFNKKQ